MIKSNMDIVLFGTEENVWREEDAEPPTVRSPAVERPDAPSSEEKPCQRHYYGFKDESCTCANRVYK